MTAVADLRPGDRVAFTFQSLLAPAYEVTGVVYRDGYRLRVDTPQGRFVVRGELGQRNPHIRDLRVFDTAAVADRVEPDEVLI